MDLKLNNTYDRLKEHYELTDQEVDNLRSLPLKQMFSITEALKESNYERLDELISTVTVSYTHLTLPTKNEV